jgi:hypothetical protein
MPIVQLHQPLKRSAFRFQGSKGFFLNPEPLNTLIKINVDSRSKRVSNMFGWALEEGAHVAFDLRLGKGANEPVNEFPILKEKQSWNTLGGVLRCGHRVLIYVEFCDLNSTCILRGESIEDWGYHVARTAPRCPAVDHYGVWAGEDHIGECTIRYEQGMIKESPGHERRAALGAYRLILQPVPGYTVLGATIGA